MNPKTRGGAVYVEETDTEAESEESIEIEVTRNEFEEEFESEIEVDTNQEYQNEYTEDNDESVEPAPEREVFIKKSKSADRNRRRRHKRKVTRDQEKKHVTERIDETHPKMRLYTRRKSRTSSEDDARAKPQSVNPKTTAEEEEVQDTKVPKNKKKNRRQ